MIPIIGNGLVIRGFGGMNKFLSNYITKLNKIADNAKDISPLAPILESKAVQAVGENITAISTFQQISLVGSNRAIHTLTKKEIPNLQKELFRGVVEV